MFQPNSIRTLRDLKLQNQLERGELNYSDVQVNESQENVPDLSKSWTSQNPIHLMMQQKSLLKEVNVMIDDLREWRIQQKKDLNEVLLNNKLEFHKQQGVTSCLDDYEQEEQQEKEYLERQTICRQRLEQLKHDLKLDVKENGPTYSYMGSEAKTMSVAQKLEKSNTKLGDKQFETLIQLMESQNVARSQKKDMVNDRDNDMDSINSQLKEDLINYERFLDHLLDHPLEIPRDDNNVAQQQTISIKQECENYEKEINERKEQQQSISSQLKEMDDDFAEIDALMAQHGIK